MKAFPPSLQIVGVALAGAALTACSSMTGAPSAGSARLGPAVGAHPTVATHQGSGSLNDASSFSCR